MNCPIIRDFIAKHPHHKDLLEAVPSLMLLDLIQFMCPFGVKVGGIYKHFKGDWYKVLGFMRPSDHWDGELYVRYVQIDDIEHMSTRAISEFLENVERDDYQGPRFTLVG